MRWFRDTLRQGSWLALIALAINLGLSLGHVHAIDGRVSGRGIATAAASIASPDHGHKQGHPYHGDTDDLCPICRAATAMASALASAPPALPSKFANVTIDRTVEPVFALAEPSPAAFQSRGPPIS
jgi:hypothetical protein